MAELLISYCIKNLSVHNNDKNWDYNGLCTLEILRSEDFESTYDFIKEESLYDEKVR